MKSIITSILGMAVLAVLPITTFASTYQYVNTDGNVQSTVANSASDALLVSNLGANSGVMLVSSSNVVFQTNVPVNTIGVGSNTYAYVNTNGNIQYVNANSPAQALTVSNLGANSGVMAI